MSRSVLCSSTPLPRQPSVRYPSSTDQQTTLGFYLVIGAAGLLLVIVISVAFVVKRVRKKAVEAKHQSESDSLIPKPKDGPVYAGF